MGTQGCGAALRGQLEPRPRVLAGPLSVSGSPRTRGLSFPDPRNGMGRHREPTRRGPGSAVAARWGGAGGGAGRGSGPPQRAAAAAAARARPGSRGECGGSRGPGRRAPGRGVCGPLRRDRGGRGHRERSWGRSPGRRRAIAGTQEVSAWGPRLGRAGLADPTPSPGPAAARGVGPAALRNGAPCWRPGAAAPHPDPGLRPPS